MPSPPERGSHSRERRHLRNYLRLALAAAAALAAAVALAACGSSKDGYKGPAVLPLDSAAAKSASSRTCPQTVLDVLGRIVLRVYREGVFSERTASAKALIGQNVALREAVEHEDPAAAKTAAEALIATGHMTNLRVVTETGRTLVDIGGPALTPLNGTVENADGEPIAKYLTSVWSDVGFIAENNGLAQGQVSLRYQEKTIASSFPLPDGPLPNEGKITIKGIEYQYTSFPAARYPSGAMRVYLLRSIGGVQKLCGSSSAATVINTLSRIATLIYEAEGGPRTLPQIERVQHNQPLLAAVAAKDRTATRKAIFGLLNHHIVRMRVSIGGKLFEDVGGPYVLQPVSAELTSGGRKIGSFTISIQDDEGYLRLTHRLADLSVLMYMHAVKPPTQRLVKNSLAKTNPGEVPTSGPYTYEGKHFQVFTINARAFPQGPLTIKVLIPIPYE
ncbi:MAG TPA: hypothetical protein VH025_02165 [Solirubrobacteraceae bacterium]|nr:hypothetical protein [Solirubrobacteraceae bacterium]